MDQPKNHGPMMASTQLHDQVVYFLVGMGIPPGDQDQLYQLEIAYRMGYEDAVGNYAVWNDGVQYVGAMRRPLREVLADFKNKDIPLRY